MNSKRLELRRLCDCLGLVQIGLVALSVVAFGACGGTGSSGSSPTQPSSPAQLVGISGVWSGAASDSTGNGTISLTLTQVDAGVTGSVSVRAQDGTVPGTISGTMSGTVLTFTMSISPGATCSTTASGTADTSPTQINGTYTGIGTCVGRITDGTLTLKR